jgi:hypothetical protein
MIINWNNPDVQIFISREQAEEVMAILYKYGLVGDWEWMTIGNGFNKDGEDADWHQPDTKVENDEFWELELWEMYGKDIKYPWAGSYGGFYQDEEAVESLKKNLLEFAGEILYDRGYMITTGFLTLVAFDLGSDTDVGRNDDYESYFGSSWNIIPDLTKVALMSE